MDIITKSMIELFQDNAIPTTFLSSFFKDNEPTNALEIPMDIEREQEFIAIDIIPGTGPDRNNKLAPYTSKVYTPPEYNEQGTLTAEEMYKRMPGKTAYDPVLYAQITQANIVKLQLELFKKIERAIEVQARDAFISGQINLVNNDTIDFKQKTSHQIQSVTPWSNPAADVIADLENACNINRIDGKIQPDIGIFGADSFNYLLTNNTIKSQASYTVVEREKINMPQTNNTGGVFHGFLAVGSYKLQIWTYPQFYQVPIGFGLPNEGQSVPYIPDDKVIVMASKGRYDKKWGGIATFGDSDYAGSVIAGAGSFVPVNTAMRYMPYYKKPDWNTINVGVRSKPLLIPTQIDAISVVTTSAP